jgi:hypothetical protein
VTGIILFVNKTPVKWISKRQKTVESSTYGSELVAARIATDLAVEYRYALRMLGIEVDGPPMMFGDNKSVMALQKAMRFFLCYFTSETACPWHDVALESRART